MDIVQIISTLGFPIACVIALGWFVKTTFDKISTANTNREARLFETIGKQEEVLRQLSDTNAKFLDTLGDISKQLNETREDVEDIKNILNISNRKDD